MLGGEKGLEGLGGWRASGSFGFAQDDRGLGGVEMGGGGRARRAMPTLATMKPSRRWVTRQLWLGYFLHASGELSSGFAES